MEKGTCGNRAGAHAADWALSNTTVEVPESTPLKFRSSVTPLEQSLRTLIRASESALGLPPDRRRAQGPRRRRLPDVGAQSAACSGPAASAGASALACDFVTVETAFLQRIYVLFFIWLATRRVEYIACTASPDGVWVTQQARNVVMQVGDEQSFRLLIHDRDKKFSHAFDGVFCSEGIEVIRTPIQAPNANAYAERWVRTVRADCLDRILILGRRHLEHVLRVYRCHYNEHRPHRAFDLLPPDGPIPLHQGTAAQRVRRRDLLGGLIREYQAAA